MQSPAAFKLFPSFLSLINSRKLSPSTRFVVNTLRLSCSSNQESLSVQTLSELPPRAWQPLSTTANLPLIRPWSGLPDRRLDTSANATLERVEEEEKYRFMKLFELGCLFGLCYLCSVYFNIYKEQLAAFVPLTVAYAIRNIVTNMILGRFFTRTIKVIDPLLCDALVLSAMLLANEVGSYLPIVGGVAMVSLTVASLRGARYLRTFDLGPTKKSSNMLSKKVMAKKQKFRLQQYLNSITLFLIIMIMSYFLFPVTAIVTAVPKDVMSVVQATGLNVKQLCTNFLLCTIFTHVFQMMEFGHTMETDYVATNGDNPILVTVSTLIPPCVGAGLFLIEPAFLLFFLTFYLAFCVWSIL